MTTKQNEAQPIRLTFDGHGFNDAGDPYRRRFATLASYYTHPYRARGETDALCEFVVRAVNSHSALVEALEEVLPLLSQINLSSEGMRGEATERAESIARAALAAAKGTK